MAESKRNAFSDKEHEQSVQPQGRYVRQRCFAEGCYCYAVFMTDPVNGRGLCGYHFAAEDANTWPKISNLLRRAKAVDMVHALHELDMIKHFGFKECEGAIVKVQECGKAVGMALEDLQLQELECWRNGMRCIETEVPAAFYYRVSMAFESYIVQCAKPEGYRGYESHYERGMKHISEAFAFLEGRKLPAHIRPAGEAA